MSQGQGGGRPRKFESVADLDRLANAYFDSCEPEIGGDGKATGGRPITAYGLARACGTTWETLRDYRSGKYDTESEKFSLAVKVHFDRVKEFAEEGLYTARSAAGPIFHLVNLTRADGDGAWKNAQAQEITGKDGGPLDIALVDRLKEARERAANKGDTPN